MGCGRRTHVSFFSVQSVAMSTPIVRTHATADDHRLHAALRREVVSLRRRHGRRRFDTVVHVGELWGERRSCPLYPDAIEVLDAGTRTEVVAGLLAGLSSEEEHLARAQAWLTRYGEPELQDEDTTWLSAAARGFGVLGCALEAFWTITRSGWIDVRTGECRVWKRPRA